MSIQGVSIAFSDDWNVENPTWTQIDTGTPHYQVTSWTIDRGRQSELDKTSTGEAQINLVDWSGAFDPTYSGGTFFGNMDPMKQVAIALQNPTSGAWSTLFRGFVHKWTYNLDPTEKFLYITIDCVDGLEVVASGELMTDQHGEFPVPAASTGEVYYINGSLESTSGTLSVDGRINAVLDDAGWPSGLRSVFTGNVPVQPAIYAARSQFLTAIDDAADAEFPGVANRYISKDGIFTFHGRLARFNPADVQYDITTWKVGDDAAVASDSTRARIVPPLTFIRDTEDIVNAVYSAPQGILDQDISGQFDSDAASIAKYGYRSLSFENLLTEGGFLETPNNNANDETFTFAEYYVDNKADPLTRVPQLTFKGIDKGARNATRVWNLLCGIDISDIIDLKTTHAWGGGFAETYFVEGLHYECRPGSSRQHDVTLTVDISPQAYYDTNPWA